MSQNYQKAYTWRSQMTSKDLWLKNARLKRPLYEYYTGSKL